MARGLPIGEGLLTLATLLWICTGPTGAAADSLLAGYEPSETSLSLSSPDAGMALAWPLAGGASGVPPATEGSHVLRMQWTGETDRKVEVRHDWTGGAFDLDESSWIRADVWIETASALPGITGIFDDVFGWNPGLPVPGATGAWVTVSACVFDRDQTGLDHILALLFEQLAGDDGTLYLDNLRLVDHREVSFSGRSWRVKCGQPAGPGPNFFSAEPGEVWVDGSGRLHLTVRDLAGTWTATEVVAVDSLGFGDYAFTVETNADALDPNLVVGLFTWDGGAPLANFREMDVELSRWGVAGDDNAQFVVQPYTAAGNRERFDIDYTGGTDTTTHVFRWHPGRIEFISYYGPYVETPAPGDVIHQWVYTGPDIPPPGAETPRINFWLLGGAAPSDSQDAELVVSAFRFAPAGAVVPALGPGALGLAFAGLLGASRRVLRQR